jgi:carbon-monoxide dehydrogenase large subunit
VAFDRITLLEGDTADTPTGGGTQGSRSVQLGGSAILLASREVLEKARTLAAHLLEASRDDVVPFDDGLGVAGVPAAAISWPDLAAAAHDPARLPAGMAPGLMAAPGFTQADSTYPFGAHLAVVEVDAETGKVTLLRMVAVDDCGTVVNPLLAAGQVHGGVASGIGQALYEESVFDAEGNPLTISFADYALPTAAELPMFEVHHTETPTPMNPLGAKGIGESGTIGSVPAVQNAVVDALSHLGVRHIDLPCTPERVWRAIQDAPVA